MTDIERFIQLAIDALETDNKSSAVVFFTAAAVEYAKKGEMNKVDKVLQESIFPLVRQEEYIDIQEKVYSHWKGGEDNGDSSKILPDNDILVGEFEEAEDSSGSSQWNENHIPPPDSDTKVSEIEYTAICWCLAKLWTDKGFKKQIGKRFPQAVDSLTRMRKRGKKIARKG